MSNPVDEIDICNLALDHLKQAPIVNIESPTTEVEALMARQYPQARRAALRIHPWNFASFRTQLTASSDYTPVVGYTHAFRKPGDFIRLLSRIDADGLPMSTEYDLEGPYILMDADDDGTLYIRYTRDIEDPGEFDPLFIDYLAINLALRVSSKFSGSEARATALREMLVTIKNDARAIDGQERPPRKIERSAFIQARRGIRRPIGRDQRYTYFS